MTHADHDVRASAGDIMPETVKTVVLSLAIVPLATWGQVVYDALQCVINVAVQAS